jgi:hypothetical protein
MGPTQGWKKSTRCESSSCVEVLIAPTDGSVYIRDGKAEDGPVLRFSQGQWSDFIAGIKTGQR